MTHFEAANQIGKSDEAGAAATHNQAHSALLEAYLPVPTRSGSPGEYRLADAGAAAGARGGWNTIQTDAQAPPRPDAGVWQASPTKEPPLRPTEAVNAWHASLSSEPPPRPLEDGATALFRELSPLIAAPTTPKQLAFREMLDEVFAHPKKLTKEMNLRIRTAIDDADKRTDAAISAEWQAHDDGYLRKSVKSIHSAVSSISSQINNMSEKQRQPAWNTIVKYINAAGQGAREKDALLALPGGEQLAVAADTWRQERGTVEYRQANNARYDVDLAVQDAVEYRHAYGLLLADNLGKRIGLALELSMEARDIVSNTEKNRVPRKLRAGEEYSELGQ